jgi:anti-anti-sigma factor
MTLTPKQLLHTRSVVTGDRACVQIAGELDMATVAEVDRAVMNCLTCRPQHLELDLDCLTFCDATGLRALRRARDEAEAQGCTFRLVGVTPHIRRIFAMLLAPDLLPAPPPAGPRRNTDRRHKTLHIPG